MHKSHTAMVVRCGEASTWLEVPKETSGSPMVALCTYSPTYVNNSSNIR